MKINRKLILPVALFVLFAFTGCASQDAEDTAAPAETILPEEQVAIAKQKLDEADNYTAELYATVKMGESEAETRMQASIAVSKEPAIMAIQVNNYIGAQMQSSEMYLEELKDGSNLYMSYEDEWTELTLEKENADKTVRFFSVKDNIDVLLSAGNGWEATQADNGGVVLTGVIPANKVYTVAEEGRFLQLVGMAGISENYFDGVSDVEISIYLDKDGVPQSAEADFAKTLNVVTTNVLADLDGASLEIESYFIEAKIIEINGVEPLSIPEQARKQAINYEEEIMLQKTTK